MNQFSKKMTRFFRKARVFCVRSINRVGTFFEKLPEKLRLFWQRLKTLDKRIWIAAGSVAAVAVVVLMVVLIPSGVKKPDAEETVISEASRPTEPVLQIEVVQDHVQPEETEVEMKTFSIDVGQQDSEIVPLVQERLIELNYLDNDEPSEIYTEDMQVAVLAFQRRCSDEINGIVNNSTYNLLFSGAAPVYMAMLGDEGDDIAVIQERLIEMDYLKGKATGYFGDETQAAVLKFQKNNKLEEDGKVGSITMEKLYSDDVVPNYTAYGEESEEIKALQQKLKKLGYLTTEPDGKFGKDTVMAVRQFQIQHDLIADGYIGPQTKNLLNSSDAKYNTISYGMSGTYVTRIQERLKELNYLKSSATGYFGSATQDAVAAFQKRNGLAQDGKVGKYTMTTLMSSNAKKAAATSNKTKKPTVNNNNKNDTTQTVNPPSYEGKASVEKLLTIAKSKLGCKYVRGGKGPNKFDCSGYVYWCLNQTGVKVNYMTSATWQKTDKFKRIKNFEDMKAGDIISMKGHVAIYAGNNMMYDASSGNGKVVYRAADRPWVKKAFVCAYRVFD